MLPPYRVHPTRCRSIASLKRVSESVLAIALRYQADGANCGEFGSTSGMRFELIIDIPLRPLEEWIMDLQLTSLELVQHQPMRLQGEVV